MKYYITYKYMSYDIILHKYAEKYITSNRILGIRSSSNAPSSGFYINLDTKNKLIYRLDIDAKLLAGDKAFVYCETLTGKKIIQRIHLIRKDMCNLKLNFEGNGERIRVGILFWHGGKIYDLNVYKFNIIFEKTIITIVDSISVENSIKAKTMNSSQLMHENHGFEDVFEWGDQDNVVMTVAIPALNVTKILWLALESLKRQVGIKFKWELIIMEEDGLSRSLIKEYVGKLPGCKHITHISVDLKKHGRKGWKLKGTYPLIDKWIYIASIASATSKIYVLHAADCYSSPKRLSIHYEHFRDKDCIFSEQIKGMFYHIDTNKTMLYNGAYIESLYNHLKTKKEYPVRTHLNMATKTEAMKTLKKVDQNSKIDKVIKTHIESFYKVNPYKKKHIFLDDEIDKDNWKYSLDTQGVNNISHSRTKFFKIDNPKYPWFKIFDDSIVKKFGYENINKYIPKDILDKLEEIRKSTT